jgi:sec-independent protein translocase protein TatC
MDPNAQLQSAATPATVPSAPAAVPPARRWRPGWFHLPSRGHRPEPQLDTSEMSLGGHLVELRNRIFISVFALLPGTVVGYIFSDEIIRVLKAPLPTKDPLITLALTGPFLIKLQIALVCGVILAMPVILFQLWRFISPGLTPRERSTARPWVPLALVFFALGVGLAYFILPYASGFLYGFQTPDLKLMLTADAYFGFVTTLFLAFGLVMEFPIILVLLSKVGLITSRQLRSSRRMAILGITIVSTLITPGADFVSPIAMAVTMYGLYEVSIVMIRLGGR